jgi:Calx-beta domain
MGRERHHRGDSRALHRGLSRSRGWPAVAALVLASSLIGALLVGQAGAVATAPTISIDDALTLEGSPEGTDHVVSVPVRLSEASAAAVAVNWATADGTAIGGGAAEPQADYRSGAGTLTFAPGETSKSVEILIDGGVSPEPAETFTITLSAPAGATIARGVATVTIINDDEPPPPEAGEVNVIPTGGGGQCVAVAGGGGCKPLEAGTQIPIEAVLYVNPGRSRVTVQSIAGRATFYGGRFDVNEIEGAKPILVMRLVGGSLKAKCATGNRSIASADGHSKVKPIRRLWGKGTGRFRTRGRYSSGTVRGTNWVTTDYCDGTDTRVVSGIVRVYDLVLRKGLLLKAGQSYFAKAGKIN